MTARRNAGFTLLEVLTATVMFAVIMAALYSVFSGALRLRETAYDAFEKNVPLDYVAELIKRDLANMVVPNGLLAGAMLGEKDEKGSVRLDRLKFHTATGVLSERDPFADLERVEYFVEQPQQAGSAKAVQSLVRSASRNLLAQTEELPENQSLLDGVEGLTFSYYDGQDWLDSWDTTLRADSTDTTTRENVLPLAIKMRIDFRPPETGERELLPIELVVPVAAKAVIISPPPETSGSSSGSTAGGSSSKGAKK